jgi:uncharacterized protein YjcR
MGNQNALKHGFYSRYLRTIDLQGIDAISDNLQDEIKVARIIARKVLHQALIFQDENRIEASLRCMELFTTQLLAISTLMKTNKLLGGSNITLESIITEAILSVANELKIIDECDNHE